MKYSISSCVYVILCNFLCALCLRTVNGNSNKFCFKNAENDCNFTTVLHFVKDGNRTYSNIVFSRSGSIVDSTVALTDNDGYCSKLYVHNQETRDNHFDSPESSDTLTQSDIVRNQYMTLPYPFVSHQQLEHEKMYYEKLYKTQKTPYSLIYGFTFEALNHFLYKGKNTFRSEFRVLVPGGGTDGGVPFMAEQANHTNSEVVYYDFSKTSMSFAQFKVKARGSLKVVWVIEWIESIPRLGLGKFDFSASTGVLHHLKCPQKGLKIVNDAQLKLGGANFMVYGRIARAAVYQMQELLRIINQEEQGLNGEIKNAKGILSALPGNHWFHHIPILDHKTMGDVGIYDLLLHKRDVAFSKLDLYSWLEKGGYNVVDFAHAENAIPISLKTIVDDTALLAKLTKMNTPVPHAIGELISSTIKKQDIYVSKQHDSVASLSLTEDVVFAYGSPVGFRNVMNDNRNYRKIRNETFVFARYKRDSIERSTLEANGDSKSFIRKDNSYAGYFIWPLSEFNEFVIGSLTRKPIRPKTLLSLITDFNHVTKSNISIEGGTKLFNDLFSYIKDFKIFFFKHKSVSSFPLTCCNNIYSVFGDPGTPNMKQISQHTSLLY